MPAVLFLRCFYSVHVFHLISLFISIFFVWDWRACILLCVSFSWLFHHCRQSNNQFYQKSQIVSILFIFYHFQSATAYITVSFLLWTSFLSLTDPDNRVVRLWLFLFDILWMLEWLNYRRHSGFSFSKPIFFCILSCFCSKEKITVYVC